jgi:hypothetical protein
VTPERCLAVDWLQCLSLSTFQTYVARVIHSLLEKTVWLVDATTEESIAAASFRLIGSELESWYQSAAGRHCTKIENLTPAMFGSRSGPSCFLKDAETNGFLEFVVTILLARFQNFSQAADIRRAGTALLSLLNLIRAHPKKFPIAAVQNAMDYTKRYLKVCEKLQWATKPKDHELMHLVQRSLEQGSPALYGNWLDESLNKHLKGIAAVAHRAVWERRILSEFRFSRGLGDLAKRSKFR